MTDKHNAVAMADAVAPRTIMHPMVSKLIDSNPTPEALEKLLALQRDWEAGEAKRAYTAALVELKRALPTFLTRDKIVDFQSSKGQVRYSHTSLAGAMDQVTPILTEYGFSLTWKPGQDGKGGVVVTAKLTHRLGHSEEATLIAPPDANGLKSAAQAIASTVTLLQRYTALALLGLATAEHTEPTGEQAEDAGRVDTSRNMRAMSSCLKEGKTRAEVLQFVGKPIQQWTAKDLDRLRGWLDGAPKASDAVPAEPQREQEPEVQKVVEKVSKAEIDNIKALRLKWKLTPDQMGALITEALGRHPAQATDITKDEYSKIVKVFQGLESGAYNLRDGKIQMPPDVGAAVRPVDLAGKTVEQLNREAVDEGVPF